MAGEDDEKWIDDLFADYKGSEEPGFPDEEIPEKISAMESLRGLGRDLKSLAGQCADGIAYIVIIGLVAGGIAAKVKYDYARMSPEKKACYAQCQQNYSEEMAALARIDDKHNCSSDWKKYTWDIAWSIYGDCKERCDEEEKKRGQ